MDGGDVRSSPAPLHVREETPWPTASQTVPGSAHGRHSPFSPVRRRLHRLLALSRIPSGMKRNRPFVYRRRHGVHLCAAPLSHNGKKPFIQVLGQCTVATVWMDADKVYVSLVRTRLRYEPNQER